MVVFWAQFVLVGGGRRAGHRGSNGLGAGAALDGGGSSAWSDSSCAAGSGPCCTARGALDWGSALAGRARGRKGSLLGRFGTKGAEVEAKRGLNRRGSGRWC
jgi:hypothetical protein